MDIRKWLEGTADRAQPDRSEGVDVRAFLQRDDEEPAGARRNYRQRKRKRVSSDSLGVATHSSQSRTRRKLYHRPSSTIEVKCNHVASSHSGESFVASHKAPSKQPKKTYERRSRHKTKADRYERKVKKPRKERDWRKEKQSAQKRRRSEPSGDGARTAGLIQSFKLKDGPKNKRLTLKPETSAGLFKHGRAGVEMTGRGHGLPDLAFNEMKFLQRPAKPRDEHAEAEKTQDATRTDRRKPNHEEISAYFAATKAPNNEPSRNRDKPREESTAHAQFQESIELGEPLHKSASVRPPQKPFLGFGSKCGQTGGRETSKHSNNCFSWSESAPRNSRPKPKPRTSQHKQHNTRTISNTRSRNVDAESHARHTQGPGQEAGATNAGKWIPSRRIRGKELVEVYQAPAETKARAHRHRTSMTGTTSQSLSQHDPSKPHHDGHQTHSKAHDEPIRSSYRTSDVLKILEHCKTSTAQQAWDHSQQNGQGHPTSDKENEAPASSFDQILYHAAEAVRKQKGSIREEVHRPRRPLQERFADGRPSQPTHSFEHCVQTPNRIPLELWLEKRPDLTSEQQQNLFKTIPTAQNDHALGLRPRLQSTMQYDQHFAQVRQQQISEHISEQADDDEMLEIRSANAQAHLGNHLYATGRQAEDLVFRTSSVPLSSRGKARVPRSEPYLDELATMSEPLSTKTISERAPSIGYYERNEQLLDHQSELKDDFVWFWKPNKLY